MFNAVAVDVDPRNGHNEQPWLALLPILGEFYFVGHWYVFAAKRKAGAPGRTRTSNPQIRSLVLYPIELRVQRGRAM